MALAAGILWEFQPTAGASTNGGGFDPSVVAPGTDHALAGTTFARADIVIEADTTTITSAGDPFASDDDGNVIQITAGATATPGYYTIVSEAGGVATLDRSAGTAGGSVTGAIGPLDIFTDAFLDGTAGSLGPQAGDTIYVKNNGTMTLGGSLAVGKDGTDTDPIIIEGYDTTRGDDPTGTNRPLIAGGAWAFGLDNRWQMKHVRITTTHANGLKMDINSLRLNVKIENSSGVADCDGHHLGGGGARAIDCEASSTNGQAFVVAGVRSATIENCYGHDSIDGVVATTSERITIRDSIIETCTAGIDFTSAFYWSVEGCTIYGNTNGIVATTAAGGTCRNNLIDTNSGTGIIWTTEQLSNFFDFNNYNGNGADVSNVTKGANATAQVPGFTDAAGGDFRVGTNVQGTGAGMLQVTGGVGADSTVDQGAWQAAGGAALAPNIGFPFARQR